jgi:hypothetical protein
MRCVASQPYATVGDRSCPRVLGHNRWPMVPRVIYPDKLPLLELWMIAPILLLLWSPQLTPR